jgi:hypothetical protein
MALELLFGGLPWSVIAASMRKFHSELVKPHVYPRTYWYALLGRSLNFLPLFYAPFY